MFRRLRAYFFAGILVTTPVAVTFAVAWWFIGWIDSKIIPLIPPAYNPAILVKEYLGVDWGVPGLGLLILLVVLTLIGASTAGFVGRWLMHMGDTLISKLPVLRVVYTASKQILETVMRDQSSAFQRVVMIEYPRKGLWVVAFVTNETDGLPGGDKDLIAVFVPTTPNPTSGFVIYVDRADTREVDMTVEDAVKLVISIGMIQNDKPKVP